MYVYIKFQPDLYTVGFYSPDGAWQPESDCTSAKEAAERVAWLNGSGELIERMEGFERFLSDLQHSDTIKNILSEEREYAEAMLDAADARSY